MDPDLESELRLKLRNPQRVHVFIDCQGPHLIFGYGHSNPPVANLSLQDERSILDAFAAAS